MTRGNLLCAATVIVVISILAFAPIPKTYGQDDRVRKWEEDIDYLTRRLEIMHPNLYASMSKDEFLGFADDLKRKIPASTDIDMLFGIQELMALVKNVHTVCQPLFFLDGLEDFRKHFKFYPVRLYPLDDGLFVLSAAKEYKRAIGKRVLRVGRLSAEETMTELARFVDADNHMSTLSGISRWCLNDGQLLHYIGASDSPNRVTLRLADEDGSAFDFEIEAVAIPDLPLTFQRPFVIPDDDYPSMNAGSENPLPLYLKHLSHTYWFEYLPEQEAVFLQMNEIWNNTELEPFDDFCQRLFDTIDSKNVQKLIIDLRLNTGGNHIELPFLKGILARPALDQHDRLFLIIGRETVSAAQHLTSELETYTNATLLGEETSSKPNQYGAMRRFNLPNSGLEIACAVDYYQDAQPFDFSMSSEPDIFVPLTSHDLKTNRDPVFEKIMTYDEYKHLRPEFFAAMSKAYTDGGIDGLKEAYNRLKGEYIKHGFNMELLLYDDFRHWLFDNRESNEEYVAYMEFVHSELPGSIVVTHRLAAWMEYVGRQEEAKALYRECLKLNPEHHYARYKLGLIEFEEAWSSH